MIQRTKGRNGDRRGKKRSRDGSLTEDLKAILDCAMLASDAKTTSRAARV
jgi:hypothetical protein